MDHLEHGLGQRTMRVENALTAHAHGEVHVIAQAIGEEELGGREGPVLRRDAKHLKRVGLGADHHVVLEMHGTLGEARRARRVEPEAGIVPGGVLGLEGSGGLGQPRLVGDMTWPRRAHHDHVLQMARVGENRPRLGEERLRDHGHAGTAVIEEIEIVLGAHHRVDGYGHRANLDGPPEGGEEGRGVEEETQHPVFLLDAEAAERIARPVDLLLEPGIGQLALVVKEGDLAAASFGHVAIHEERRGIEAVRHLERRQCHLGTSVERRV